MTIEELKESLNKPHYDQKEIKQLLSSLDESRPEVINKTVKPSLIKRGDVFLNRIGTKSRPCVVVRVKEDTVMYIPLTSTNDHMVLMPCSGRFYEGGYFVNALLTTEIAHVRSHFIGIYEKTSDITKAMQELKKYFKL